MRKPITDADRDQVRQLHAENKSRNEIARIIGRSGSTVSKIAAELDLSFERGPEVVAATEARRVDLAGRQQLAEALHESAEQLHRQLFAPCTIGAFGGKDNVWSEQNLDRPTFADQRQILAATSIAIDKSLKLAPAEAERTRTRSVRCWAPSGKSSPMRSPTTGGEPCPCPLASPPVPQAVAQRRPRDGTYQPVARQRPFGKDRRKPAGVRSRGRPSRTVDRARAAARGADRARAR
ncbi:helix-turn-helix domain-containing protein [Streptomyces antimycoticus]|uniref:helix-turn-helix domain-containing protein n=1 Tax=Streptomyces antimycoticus TaxID=68175 RepID=UPI001F489D7F|nr:helix-turn-helix domain-containing protein [Streptomyces antimycoticus]